MLDALMGEGVEPMNPDELECVFIQSLYGSLGAAIISEDRKIFDALIKKTAGFMTVDDTDTKLAGYRKLFNFFLLAILYFIVMFYCLIVETK